ncbi:FAD-dependent oxidoreductase [uncultured Phocaeicola sp.]|uniref:FAD-dependent oxidoreductase n=1 Tax=uncultured Phocaeicola sp. TaxID=990718 RepID=UPI0025833CDC|nr:FAD-dependent oxidoreductase [uncultured Phocaeicola sp.]
MKYVIVGGVAGGATAAARIRRNTEDAEIILFEKGEYISYANCGLPYYIGGVIAEREKLFVQTPQAFGKRFNIDVRTQSEVVAVHPAEKTVDIRTSDGKTYTEHYDKLLLSPGASPVRPPLPGIDNEGIFTLRNVNDTDAIKGYLQQHKVKRAVIIGAGFIGLEMAENLQEAGAEVAVVEMANQVMAPIDFSMASLVHEHLLQKGVRLYLEKAVDAFERTANGLEVIFKSGERLSADMVLLSIGVRPNTSLATEAGLEIGEMRGIKVNDYLQTSDEHIYAVGDAIEFRHPLTDKPWLNYLAGPANRQARIVADNMVFGNEVTYEGAIGTSIAKVFDMTVAASGLPAKRLKQAGIDYLSATIHSGSHAGYYPDALQMSIKITFSPTDGKLLGAQIVGYNGVDKRIDEFSQVIKHNGTVYDLMALEQAYAPPFSSAKDPVAVAGYVAGNILNGKMHPLYWRELQVADLSKITLVDVRTPDEFALGSLKGAVNIPLDDMRERMQEIPQDKPIYLYCGVGLRGYLASNILLMNGYKEVKNLIGGLKLYKAATAPLPEPKIFTATLSDGGKQVVPSTVIPSIKAIKVDACGISCPGPIMKLKKSMEELADGERLEIVATDAGFPRDAEAWCQTTGNRFVSVHSGGGKYQVIVEKNTPQMCTTETCKADKGKTFILFSDDLDKVLATFVLANGAVATGEKVTIFFTFWGLNAIKKMNKPAVKKDFFGKMFGMMLPSSSLKLKLSKMNMGGMGSKMMRYIMNKKNIESLESLREQAIQNGVEFIACQMSMDVMGVKREELLDNVTIGGVATYMNRAEQANVNLFI